jgi:hypothetical protein
MSDSLKDIMRKAGNQDPNERERAKFHEKADELAEYYDNVEQKTELEKRHDRFRQRQEYASRLGPAGERLPIITKEEREERLKNRPERRQIQFEGPIEKLIEKYQDPKEVFNHLSHGQLMKYELDEETGCIYEKGTLIFDGEKLIKE